MKLSRALGHNATSVRSNEPLTDDQIRRVAPSVFAEQPHESRSARYSYIPTVEVLDGLRSEGFLPFFAAQGRSRVEGKAEYTKHVIRLRHAGDITNQGEANEIILLNSHDGTSSYQMIAGQLRLACLNGLIVGDCYEDLRIKHKGSVVDNVIEGAYTVLSQFEAVKDSIDTMKSIELAPGMQNAFAKAALQLKYEDPSEAPIEPEQLNRARRFDDQGSDLWRTFNRVQEGMIRGGISGRRADGRRTTTRAVNAIDTDTKLNRALWTLAEEMARLAA